MSARLNETGLSQVAWGLASLSAPTPDKIEQLTSDLRSIEGAASQSSNARLATAAREAESAARHIAMGTTQDRLACARALHRVGSILLLQLLEEATSPTAAGATRSPLERKILVVDDSRVAAVALSNGLLAHDYLVRTAATMEEALAELASFRPTILVSDVHMPKLDVGVLCRTFRKMADGRPIRILLMSGLTGDELEGRLREVKPDAFAPKVSGATVVVKRVLELWEELNQGNAKP